MDDLVERLCPGVNLLRNGSHRKKCCCVFHEERTPSMIIDTTLNRFKCFGCGKGGDVITFTEESQGLDFDGAVRTLLDMYCSEVDVDDLYEKNTPEKEEERAQKKLMYEYNQYAYEFFRKKYEEDSDEAAACRAYAERTDTSMGKGRWDSEFCRTYGLGYAPQRGNQFLAYAKKKGLKLSVLAEMGLIKEDEHNPGSYYDFYRGRLMIPQRNQYNKILTFTARALTPQASHKYLNGQESLIYRKSESVFGIDVAMTKARQTGKMYLVEGAPDVMRLQSIGIGNAVASLGGAWTEQQLGMFSSFGCNLCFIPDCDEPKEGKEFGAGEENVFRNGRLAVEMGFQVSVREIPRDGHGKQDPDTYITSEKRLDSLVEKDFILWYVEKHYKKNGTNEEQMAVIADACDMLVCISSEVRQTALLNDLKDKYKKANIWKSALADAARRRKEQKRKQALKKHNELEGFHFFQKGCHYYDIDQQGREREWTNFVIRPLFLIADEDKPSRIFEMENEKGEKRTIELQQCDVTKLERFKEKIEGKGDFRFFEKPDKYEALKAYMYDKPAEAQRITQMGWNALGEKGYYAFCNGIIYEGRWQPVDEFGIVRLGEENFYLPAMSKIHRRNKRGFVNERRFIHDPKRIVTMNEYFSLMVECYGDNAIVAILFYLATLFRDIIIDSTRSFPLLNIYGQKESGKTEFALCLIYLFRRNFTPDDLDSTSYYAMGDICNEVSNMLVHFDEFKNSLTSKHIDFLKGIYDSAGRTKRAADGERRESTNVDCGVVLTGQEIPTVDIALFSRLIYLETHKSKHTREETDRFHHLLKLRNSYPTNITVDLLKYRDNFNAGWRKSWERALTDVKSSVNYNTIGERFIYNWSMMLATYYTLAPLVEDLPFEEDKVRDICIKGLLYQHSLCNTADELAIFWSMFSKARQLGDIKEGQDYKIVSVNTLKVSTKQEPLKVIEFEKPTYLIFVRDKICMAKANIQAKREGKTMIPDESLLSYLMASSDYYGKTKSPLKFYIYDENGSIRKKTNAKGEQETLYDQERVLAFDYQSICNNYDINLQTMSEKSDPKQENGYESTH